MANTLHTEEIDLDTAVIDLGGYDSTYDTMMSSGSMDTITLTGGDYNTSVGGYSTITTSTGSYNTVIGSPYTFTTSGTSGAYITSNNTWTTSNTSGITVKGDADFDGDVKVKGKSLTDWMETMEKRLAILVPDPKKLEKFEALQKAYNHYKMLEALCDIQDDPAE